MAGPDRAGASVSRRRLFTAAGGLAAGLAGCGSSTRRTSTGFEFDGADADVLDAVLAVENRAVAAYAHVAELLHGSRQALARRLGAAEAAHVYALSGAIDRLGGTPTPAARSYAFTARTGPAALVLAGEIEDMSIAACIDAIAKLTDLQARGTVVSIANSDAQHAVLVAQARGLAPLSGAIVRGRP